MITLRAKVAWIRCGGRRLAVGEHFQVESERHASPLLARGDAERVAATPPASPLPGENQSTGKDHPESQPAIEEAGTGDSGAAVTSNPAGAAAPDGKGAAPAEKPAKAPRTPKAAKPKAA